jgi:PAS domain S-box-containing protein
MRSVHSRLPESLANPNSASQSIVLACLTALVSYLAAELGGMLVLRPQMVWPIWPACAVLVAALLLMPRRIWPIVLPAGLAGFVLYDLRAGLSLRPIAILILADAIEILIAALGISYYLGDLPRLNNLKSLARYSVFAVILGPLAAAFISTDAFGGEYWIRWRIGFFTEALALLTLTPAILSWAATLQAWKPKPRSFYFEAAALISGLSLLGYVAFVSPGGSSPPVLPYALLPFLLWAALRFGLIGISTSMVVVAFLSIWGALRARGPFTGAEPLNDVMSLQLFLFFSVTTFMVLATLVEERKQADHAIRESEKRFRLVADTAPVLIWMADTTKLCTYFNKPWLDFTGRSMELELGNGWAAGVHAEDLQRCLDTYTRAFDRREGFRMEYRLRRHDGEYRWVLDIGVPRFNQDRSFIGYIGVGIDVTEHRLAEQALRESEGRFHLAAEAGKMFAYEWDASTDVLVRSAESGQILGIDESGTDEEQVTGQQTLASVHPDDRERLVASIAALTPEKPHLKVDYRMVRPDGSMIWLERTSRAHFDEQGKMLRIVGMAVDITERKRTEDALSGMGRRLIEAQEQERARIARELHDDLGQRLALLANEMEQLQQSHPDLQIEVTGGIRKLQEQTFQIAADVQSLSHELHSSKLGYLGVAVAMRSFCQEFGRQQKAKIDFRNHDLPSPVPPDISLCLFRVLQESLHNSVKHSGVRHVEVRLWGTSDEIHLTVRDSGAGFDTEAVKHSRGLGLISMEERLKILKGTFSIESQPMRGTTIHARVPFGSASDPMRATG